MRENDLVNSNASANSTAIVAVDPSPLRVKAEDSLQQVVKAMAKVAKTYALVYQTTTLVGVVSYDNVAQAATCQADFNQVSTAVWMTPLEKLHLTTAPWPLPPALDGDGEHLQPVVDQTDHWLGLLAANGLYTLPCLVAAAPEQAEPAPQHRSAALGQPQELLGLALQSSHLGTWDWDLGQGTIVISEQQEHLLGLAPGEFDGSYDSLFAHLHNDDWARVNQALQHAIRLGQRYQVEFRVQPRDGPIRWLLAQGQVCIRGQHPTHLVGVTLDISEQKQAEAELKLQLRRERQVGEIAQRIRHLLDLDSILTQTVASVREFIVADRVLVIQCGADMSGKVIHEVCAPDYPAMLGWDLRDPWSMTESFLEQYRAGRGLAIDNIYNQNLPASQLEFLEYFQIQAEIVVPLLQDQNQTLWGLLIAHQCGAPRAWRTADVGLLQGLVTQVSTAIQQAKLHHQLTLANQRLKRMAYLDGLTQVANRRRFEQHLEKEWRRMIRENGCLGVIMADIDCFKGFNDRYGHQAGDNCLRLVARILSRAVKRPTDLVARYGGEEFVIVLPNTDGKGAETVAEDIRRLVRNQRIPHEDSTVAKVVTMSLGVASTGPSEGDSPAQLIQRADEALYVAKNEGRDQVRLAP